MVRLPDDSAGKNVLCPKCAAVIAVAGGSFAPTQTGPAAGAGDNPYSAPQAAYAPPTYAVDGSGVMGNQPVDAGQVLSHAWKVWSENLGLLVGAMLVMLLISLALFGIYFGIRVALLAQGMDPLAMQALSFPLNVLLNAITTYISIGQTQMILKLIRGQPASVADLFGGGPRFWPVFGASILAGIALGIGFLLCIIPGIILALMFWPFSYVLVDNKAGVTDSFSVASTITQGNRGTTFVLALASLGIGILGWLACGIGIIFAAPLVSVMWATAYLMMSGQLAAQPAQAAYGMR